MKTRAAGAWQAGQPPTIQGLDLEGARAGDQGLDAGYDHGCLFIAIFVGDPLAHHAKALCT